MVDSLLDAIGQNYAIYSPILWIVYFVIVWRVATRVRDSHFFGLVTLNGISDLTLCLLGNFYFRWPKTASFRESLYSNFQTYSSVLAFFYFLFFHLHYAEFVILLFMSFNSFVRFILPKFYYFFWKNCFYKYVFLFILLPMIVFFNVLVAQFRFRYGQANQQYYALVDSPIPQYISRRVGTAILTSIITLCFMCYIICIAKTAMRLCQKFDQKLERLHVEDLIVGLCYSGLRVVFLAYEHTMGIIFPCVNDFLTLTPPLFLILVSSRVRELLLPCFGHQKKNRVHFNERANEVRSASEHESEETAGEQNQGDEAKNDESDDTKEDEHNGESTDVNDEHQNSAPATSRLSIQQSESDVQKIVGHSIELERRKTPATPENNNFSNKQMSIAIKETGKQRNNVDKQENESERPETSQRQSLTIPPERASTPTINA